LGPVDNERPLVRNIAALLVRQAVGWSFSALAVLFVPRYLGEEGLGEVTFALSFTLIFGALINFGSGTYLVKAVAVERERPNALFWNTLLLRACLSLPAFLLLTVVVQTRGYDREMALVMYLAMTLVVVHALGRTMSSVLQGLERMTWMSTAETVGKGLSTALALAVLVAGGSVVAYAASLLLAPATTGLLYALALVGRQIERPQLDRQVLAAVMSGSLPFLAITGLNEAYSRSDTVLLGFLTSSAVVGWYGAAEQLYDTFNFLPILLVMVALPRLTRLYANEPAHVAEATQTLVLVVLLTSLPIAFGTNLVAGDLIDLLRYPAGFDHSAVLLSLLAGALPVTGLLMVVSNTVIATNRERRWALILLASLAAALLTMLPLIPLLQRATGNGGVGAAAGIIICESLALALAVRELPAGVLNVALVERAGRLLAAAVTMWAVAFLAKTTLDAGLFGTGAVAAFTYGAAALAFGGVSVEQLRAVWAAIRPEGPGEAFGLLEPAEAARV